MTESAPRYAWEGENRSQDGQAETLAEKATSATNTVKDKAAAIGQGAAQKIDEKREPAASALESAASTVHEKAERLAAGGETVSRLAHRTAERLQNTADYVREHDTRAMMNDVEQFVKGHPAQSLVAAAALGFLVGRAFRPD
jgi:ElaB/YqjD/DUF883 family membrane-anchored ribosome-binding protein